jgi:hypothetical protein
VDFVGLPQDSVCVLLVQSKRFSPQTPLTTLQLKLTDFSPVQLCSLSSLVLRHRHLRYHHFLCLAIHRRTIPLVGQHGV